MKYVFDLDRVWFFCIINEIKNFSKLVIIGKVFCSNILDVVS